MQETGAKFAAKTVSESNATYRRPSPERNLKMTNVGSLYFVVTRDDSAPVIRRVSSQGGSLNRGMQSWGTGPPPLPREPPPQEEPQPSLQTKTPK